MYNSFFTGKLHQYIGYRILGVVVTVMTLGLAFPWAYCFIKRWEINNTWVSGKKLNFDGTGAQLFGNWIKWWFLTFITAGIYGFWVKIKLYQWVTKHTYSSL